MFIIPFLSQIFQLDNIFIMPNYFRIALPFLFNIYIYYTEKEIAELRC